MIRLLSLLFSFFLLSIHINSFGQPSKMIKTIIVDAGHGGDEPGAIGQYENSLRSNEKDVTLAISLKLVDELKKQLPELKIIPTRTTDIFQSVVEKANIANSNKGDLFICIHADSGPLQTGRRQIGTHEVIRYKVSYKGKGKKKKKITKPYTVTEPLYEYYKMPIKRNGTSVWIFAAHKTSEKLKAIMHDAGGANEDFEIESGAIPDSLAVDYGSPEGRVIAQVYAKLYQEKSNRLASYVNDEIEKTNRPALGVSQRQKGIWVLQATNMPAILVETGFINNPEDEEYLNSEKGQQELAEAITAAVVRYKQQIESNQTHIEGSSN